MTERRIRNSETEEAENDAPGLPGFRSWRHVYWFVLGCFAALVVLMAVFSRVFS